MGIDFIENRPILIIGGNSSAGGSTYVGTTNQITVSGTTIGIPNNPILPNTARVDAFYGTVTNEAYSSNVIFDMSASNIHAVTLTGSPTLSFVNDNVGQRFLVMLTQGGSGSNTVVYPSGVRWQGGTSPTLTTASGKIDIISFLKLASGSYLGVSALNF